MTFYLMSLLPVSIWDYQFWLIFVLTALLVYKLLQPRWKLVPMPHSWPIIGNSPNFPKDESLASFSNRWAKEINSGVIRLRFGFTDGVVLNDVESLQEGLIDRADDYAGRPYNTVFELMSDGHQNITFTDPSPEWRKRRQIFITSLRAFSIGEAFEERVYATWDTFRKLLDDKLGEPFDPKDYAILLITNYQGSLCYNVKFDFEDPDFKLFNDRINRGGQLFGKQLSVDNFKFLKYLPIDMPDYAEAKKLFTIVRIYNERQLQEHIKTFDPDHVRDFMDYLLKARQEAEEHEKNTVTDKHLALIVNDVFAAGMATQHQITAWIFHQLAMYPQVQEKAYQEIRDVLGVRRPRLKDRANLTYCEATVQEIIRFGTSHTILVPRKTLVDTKIAGYDVPKGTLIFPNYASVHFDPVHFPEPHLFKPERFIENGAVTRPKTFLPFGSGRRQCPGENAARNTLFLIFVLMVQNYKFSAPKGVTMKFECDTKAGVPLPFEIVLDKRV